MGSDLIGEDLGFGFSLSFFTDFESREGIGDDLSFGLLSSRSESLSTSFADSLSGLWDGSVRKACDFLGDAGRSLLSGLMGVLTLALTCLSFRTTVSTLIFRCDEGLGGGTLEDFGLRDEGILEEVISISSFLRFFGRVLSKLVEGRALLAGFGGGNSFGSG